MRSIENAAWRKRVLKAYGHTSRGGLEGADARSDDKKTFSLQKVA